MGKKAFVLRVRRTTASYQGEAIGKGHEGIPVHSGPGRDRIAAMNKEERLDQQICFLLELDRLKQIHRRTWLLHEERNENSAEHSWHVSMMALLLSEHADVAVDRMKVMQMMLVHDIVEIDAGDTYCYDTRAAEDKAEREQAAADRLFGLLPEDQCKELRETWDEFEARETAEARMAACIDRLMPLLHNFHTKGRSWKEHGIQKSQVLEHNRDVEKCSASLWAYVNHMLDLAVERGYLGDSG